MDCVGDDCRRMHCRGEITKQTCLDGSTVYMCNSCGKEYTETGASVYR